MMSIDQIKQYVDFAINAPGWAWAGFMAFIAITVWRKLPRSFTVWKFTLGFPNEALWLIGPVVGGYVCLQLAPGAPQKFDAHKWRFINECLGIGIGFLVRLAYIVLVGKLEKWFPQLKGILENNGNGVDKGPAPPQSPSI